MSKNSHISILGSTLESFVFVTDFALILRIAESHVMMLITSSWDVPWTYRNCESRN